MTELIRLKKPAKKGLNPQHKTFNSLKKKVEKLQKQLKTIHQELDQTLFLYHNKINPVNQTLIEALGHFVKELYGFYLNLKPLSKKERQKLKNLILMKIDELMHLKESPGMDSDIMKIFEDLYEMNINDMMHEEMTSLKDEMEVFCEDQGIDIDLSDIEFDGNVSEFKARISEAVDEAQAKFQMNEKPKVKKMSAKEKQEHELELLQKKGLSTIYKELAKVFHPDLAQTVEQKKENEIFMKKLTSAYKNKDLYTLLSLKIESLKKAGEREDVQNDDQLKIYNSILKEQAASIKKEIDFAIYHPKYQSIRPLVQNGWHERDFVLKMMRVDLEEQVYLYHSAVKDLQSEEGSTSFERCFAKNKIQINQTL